MDNTEAKDIKLLDTPTTNYSKNIKLLDKGPQMTFLCV